MTRPVNDNAWNTPSSYDDDMLNYTDESGLHTVLSAFAGVLPGMARHAATFTIGLLIGFVLVSR